MNIIKNFFKNNDSQNIQPTADINSDIDANTDDKIISIEDNGESLLTQLSKIYQKCDDIETPQLVDLIEKLNIQDYTPEIKRQLINIIAKRTALDCMEFGAPRIPTLARIVPVEDMYEADLPTLSYSKYKSLKKEFDDNKEFTDDTKKLIHKRLLEELAKKSAVAFDASGTFILPQIESFKKLSKEDINIFVETVKDYSKDFNKGEAIRLTKKLSGKTSAELHDLNRMLEKMPPNMRDLAVQEFVALLQNNFLGKKNNKSDDELSDVLKSIESSLRQLPSKDQLNAAKAILETLEQRNEAIALIRNVKKINSKEVAPNKGGR